MIYSTLYKIIDNIDRYSFASEKKFTSFVFVLYCNSLSNLYKKKKRIKEKLELIPFNEMLFDEAGENPSLRTEREVQKSIFKNAFENYYTESTKENTLLLLLRESLNEMEDWERVLLIQRSHNTPYKDIAEFIDKPENQLKVYHQRLRKKLITLMNEKIKDTAQCTTKTII